MHADQGKKAWMLFTGELNQPYGKCTDADLRQIEANDDMFVGRVQERYGDKNDELLWRTRGIRSRRLKPRSQRCDGVSGSH